MTLLGCFAGVALVLALIGVYDVMAYAVTQRTQELGVRRALGARDGTILWLLVRHALNVSGAGVVLGLIGSFALPRVVKALLFKVSATDSATFAGVAVIFIVVA